MMRRPTATALAFTLLLLQSVHLTQANAVDATAASACAGDCNGDGQVTITELILAVNIALGGAGVESCRAIDPDMNDRVTIDEIVRAVVDALCGCSGGCSNPPPIPSPTLTPTTQLLTPTPTAPAIGKILFKEGWEKSGVRQYAPLSLISGDTGVWLNGIGDVSDSCRATTMNFAQVVVENGSHRLELHSGRDPDCSDDSEFVEPAVTTNPLGPRDLNIPIDDNVYLSFDETGALSDPDPCDAVTLSLAFDHGDPLTYILQHGPQWDSDPYSCSGIFAQNAIVLSADGGSFVRNLSDDAASVGVFPADNINAIEVGVRSHGDATFDNLTVFSAAGAPPPPTATPTPKVTTGGGCIRVSGGNSTVKVVNSSHSMIEVYLGSDVGFGADIPAGKCFLMGIDLPDDYTLTTDVEISQCTPIDVGECGDLIGPTEDVTINLSTGQTVTIAVGNNFFN